MCAVNAKGKYVLSSEWNKVGEIGSYLIIYAISYTTPQHLQETIQQLIVVMRQIKPSQQIED